MQSPVWGCYHFSQNSVIISEHTCVSLCSGWVWVPQSGVSCLFPQIFKRRRQSYLLRLFFFNWMELLSDSASFPVCMKWARPPKRKSNIYIYYFLGSALILQLSVHFFWAAAVVESLLPNRIGIEIPVLWNIWLKRDVIENKYML